MCACVHKTFRLTAWASPWPDENAIIEVILGSLRWASSLRIFSCSLLPGTPARRAGDEGLRALELHGNAGYWKRLTPHPPTPSPLTTGVKGRKFFGSKRYGMLQHFHQHSLKALWACGLTKSFLLTCLARLDYLASSSRLLWNWVMFWLPSVVSQLIS